MIVNPDERSTKYSYCRYSRLLVLLFFLPVILAATGSFFFQPYSGPLTRIGGFLENDFGWNAPQEEFYTPLFKIAQTINDYDHYYDVVVLGDSFSFDSKKGWQNYFVNSTGLSVITFHHEIGTSQVTSSAMFRSNPPRYLVFQSLEQFALERLVELKAIDPLEPIVGDNNHSLAAGQPEVIPASRHFVKRELSAALETRTSESLDFIEKAIVRGFSGDRTEAEIKSLWGSASIYNWNTFDAYNLPLRRTASGFFSSRRNDYILVYGLDIAKQTAESLVKHAAEGAWQMKKSIESNGRTKVLMMLFPDKLTIYAPYLVDPSVAPPSLIPPLAREFPHQLRLDEVFAKAVAEGIQDLYLPSDTHCGYKGYQMAADQLALAIEEDRKQLSRLGE